MMPALLSGVAQFAAFLAIAIAAAGLTIQWMHRHHISKRRNPAKRLPGSRD